MRVLASSDLIGNPYNLVENIGTGVRMVYYEPRNGFMEGPLQGGLGILKGTAGMVGIIGASTIGTFGKVTNSLNKGIVAVSLDTDYIHAKEINDIKHKPTSFISGVGQGAKGFGKAVFSGVTDVVAKPVEGASRDGVTGFMKGLGKGLLGITFKPVSGVVDFVSKTTEGLEMQATGLPDCVQNCKRMRQPRAFYRDLGVIRGYSQLHA
jgi:vacuolar protein sorting-associated protein 13A/C